MGEAVAEALGPTGAARPIGGVADNDVGHRELAANQERPRGQVCVKNLERLPPLVGILLEHGRHPARLRVGRGVPSGAPQVPLELGEAEENPLVVQRPVRPYRGRDQALLRVTVGKPSADRGHSNSGRPSCTSPGTLPSGETTLQLPASQ